MGLKSQFTNWAAVFVLLSGSSAQAQSTFANQYNGVGSAAPYNVGAAPLVLNDATTTMQGLLSNCGANGLINSSIDAASKVGQTTAQLADKDKDAEKADKDGSATGTFTCASVCEEVHEDVEPVCSLFTAKSGANRSFKGRNGRDKANTIGRNFAQYAACLQSKVTNQCADPDIKAVQKQLEDLNCKLSALAQGEASAAQSLQSTLRLNTAQFAKMNQYETELGSQMGQVTEMLTGKKNHPDGLEFSGLLGIQKALDDAAPKMNEDEANFHTGPDGADSLVQQIKANDQTLEANRMVHVANCMSSVAVAPCYRPDQVTSTDANGKTITTTAPPGPSGHVHESLSECSPLDFIRSKLRESQLVNANGQLMAGEDDRQNQADAVAAQFDLIRDKLGKAFGVYNQVDPKTGARMGTQTQSWASVEATIAGDLSSLPPIVMNGVRVPVQSALDHFASSCFSDGDTWENDQKTQASSDYMQAVTALNGKKGVLMHKMSTSMEQMKRYYTAASSILAGVPTNWSNFDCSQTDPELAASCYSDLKTQLLNFQHGTTGSFVTKSVTGGTYVAGGNFKCSGIDTCVTTIKGTFDQMDSQMKMAITAKAKFVNDGNTSVSQQLMMFAQKLQEQQLAIDQQYPAIAAKIRSLGGTEIPNALASLSGEPLKQMDGVPGPPPESLPGPKGPYEVPETGKMAGILSSFVQPTGLTDFKSSDLSKAVDGLTTAQKEKGEALKSKIADAREAAKAYQNIEDTCDVDAASGSVSASVTNGYGLACGDLARSCMAKQSSASDGEDPSPIGKDQTAIFKTIADYFHGSFSNQSNADESFAEVDSKITSLYEDHSECGDLIRSCEVDAITKHESFEPTAPSAKGPAISPQAKPEGDDD